MRRDAAYIAVWCFMLCAGIVMLASLWQMTEPRPERQTWTVVRVPPPERGTK